MYYFFRSWRDSLSLFIPQNAKLFLLVTLKTILTSYKKILTDLWWLLLISSLVEYGIKKAGLIKSEWSLAPTLLWLFVFYLMYRIARPSLPQKNWRYYLTDWWKFIYFILLSLLAISLPIILLHIPQQISFHVGQQPPFMQQLLSYLYLLIFGIPLIIFSLLAFLMAPNVMPVYVSPLLSFIVLFLLDSRGTPADFFKSIWRALKMVIYNYPFCLIMYTVILFGTYYLQQLIYYFLGGNTLLFSTLVGTLAFVIPLSIWTMFYTKRLHDQFNLYYPESVKE